MKSFLTLLLVAFTLSAFAQSEEKIDADKDYVITIKTAYGDMVVLLSDNAPLHKANFVKLAKSGFYDSTTFHRVIDGFMIQGGDTLSKDNIPTNDGMGNIGYTIPAELSTGLKHKKGAIAAARIGDQMNPQRASNGSQFYIVLDDKGASHLDGQYSVYGQVVDGLDVMGKVAEQQTDNRNRPLDNVYMTMKVEEMKRSKIIKKYKAKSFYEAK
ncbi:MAG: peptidylprolyl isomerase [Cytophagaceae bacterium]|jgi:cyclophilin family peptidyl-prolyl cis-trans isomerase|nr:peptidylprolyl isomerase [Cytophagaceae bacterium]